MHPVLAFTLIPYVMLQNSSGMECACPVVTTEERIANAAYAFEITIRGTGDLCDGNIYREGEKPWLTRVEVLAVRKGELPEQPFTFIRHDEAPSACGVTFEAGKHYLVFGNKDARGFYEADACSVISSPDDP